MWKVRATPDAPAMQSSAQTSESFRPQPSTPTESLVDESKKANKIIEAKDDGSDVAFSRHASTTTAPVFKVKAVERIAGRIVARAVREGDFGTIGSVIVADTREAVSAITLSWSPVTQKRLKVMATFADPPQAVREKETQRGGNGREKGVFHDNGKPYVIVGNHTSIADIEDTVFHETYGHLGFSKLFGKDITSAINHLFVAIGGNHGIHDIAKKFGINLTNYQARISRLVDQGRITKEQHDAIILNELLAYVQGKRQRINDSNNPL